MEKSKPVMLEAIPYPLEIDLNRTAVIVVDMQNCFVSNGGMFDLLGHDVASVQVIIGPIKAVTRAARTAGCRVIYLKNTTSPDLRECGGLHMPYWHRGVTKIMRERPEWRDKVTIRDTWGVEIIDELKPEQSDIVVEKAKYSGFVGTTLNFILQTYDIRYLVFTGTATNICVESTLRDSFFHGYWPVIIPDGCAAIGPPATQEATVWNVQAQFGWSATGGSFIKAIK
ncbi:cysteine hydrolase family protein [Chloroflexota bacterium]